MARSSARPCLPAKLVPALLALSTAAALAYPERPVRVVVGAAAGGSSGLPARLLAEAPTARLPRPVVVENRYGAAGRGAAWTRPDDRGAAVTPPSADPGPTTDKGPSA